MGSPLSPTLANLFTENFEVDALRNASKRPKLCLRYVNAAFVIWQRGEKEFQNVMTHLNYTRQNIKFPMTKEDECDRKTVTETRNK